MTKSADINNELTAKGFDALPIPAMFVDDDVRIILLNAAAKKLFPHDEDPMMKRGGEALQCVNAEAKGCGKGELCGDCVIRGAVNEALKKNETILYRRTHLKLLRDGKRVMVNLLVTATPVKPASEKLVILIVEDINELINLSRLLPICANCKKIRDEKGSWENVEKYIEDRVDVDFSHGVCPTCMEKLYGESGK